VNELSIGAPAPDFTLPSTSGAPVTLSELRGGPVALVFFPFAFSRTCTGELCELRDNFADFQQAGVTLLGVSCDPPHSQTAFRDAEGYQFDLLSDFWPHGAVARRYGVFDEAGGLAIRGSFIVDAGGILRWSVVNPRSQARPLAAYREALSAL
jgi:peroxiredoxin